MKFWLGVTDNNWFDFLSRNDLDEVSFWQPSGTAPFKRLETGAPFLFKLKRPYNHVAGGGTFVKFSKLPLSLVWDVFGTKNGAQSREAFEAMIRPLISDRNVRDPEIGCTILTAPFFWSREDWIPNPVGWAGNIVRGRYYNTNESDGASLWSDVETKMYRASTDSEPHQVREAQQRYGNATLTRPRLGQGAFRVVVTDAYQRQCAITGENTLPVLEAAHIKPFSENGENEIGNGLLLRSDFHKLLDVGLVTVTPELRVEVSPEIKERWFNGKAYYSLHGKCVSNLPQDQANYPSKESLRWHNENVFIA